MVLSKIDSSTLLKLNTHGNNTGTFKSIKLIDIEINHQDINKHISTLNSKAACN